MRNGRGGSRGGFRGGKKEYDGPPSVAFLYEKESEKGNTYLNLSIDLKTLGLSDDTIAAVVEEIGEFAFGTDGKNENTLYMSGFYSKNRDAVAIASFKKPEQWKTDTKTTRGKTGRSAGPSRPTRNKKEEDTEEETDEETTPF